MRSVFAISVAAMLLTGCLAEAEMATAENGVAEFRQLMASGRHREIYSTAAEDFRQTGSEANATKFLQHVAERLGAVRHSTKQGWRVTAAPGGTMVTLS